jgi:hypothetical protein
VGASFILPFVLFIFHVLTKTYPADENQSEYENRLVIAYKSSFKKHNDVVFALASLLEKLTLNRVDVVDLSKKEPKIPGEILHRLRGPGQVRRVRGAT